MLLGGIVKEARNKKGLSQAALAKGICEQSYISRLENQNIPPRNLALIAILQRLDLTLNDIYSEFSTFTKSEILKQLYRIERAMILNEPVNLQEQLDMIDVDDKDNNVMAVVDYMYGLINFRSGKENDAIFQFNKVLHHTQEDNYDVYTIQAYLGLGLVYLKGNDMDKASYCFGLVEKDIKQNMNITNAMPEQLLYILKGMSTYCFEIKDYNKLSIYVDRALKINVANYTNIFLDFFYDMKLKLVEVEKSKVSAKEIKKIKNRTEFFKEYLEEAHQNAQDFAKEQINK